MSHEHEINYSAVIAPYQKMLGTLACGWLRRRTFPKRGQLPIRPGKAALWFVAAASSELRASFLELRYRRRRSARTFLAQSVTPLVCRHLLGRRRHSHTSPSSATSRHRPFVFQHPLIDGTILPASGQDVQGRPQPGFRFGVPVRQGTTCRPRRMLSWRETAIAASQTRCAPPLAD